MREAGEPRRHLQAIREGRYAAIDPGGNVGLFGARPNPGHLAPDDVDDLRQFVDAQAAQYRADAGWTLVVFRDGSEFDYVEASAALSGTFLHMENPPPVLQADGGSDGDREYRPKRCKWDESREKQREVEIALVSGFYAVHCAAPSD